MTRFDVLPGDRNEVYGMMTLRPDWHIGEQTASVPMADRSVALTLAQNPASEGLD